MLFSLMWNQNWENVAVLGLFFCVQSSNPTPNPESCECYYFSGGVSAVSHCWVRWLEAFVHMLTCFYAACCSHKAPGDGPKHARLTEGSGEFPNLVVFEQERKGRGCRRDQALAGGCPQRSAQQGGGGPRCGSHRSRLFPRLPIS